MTQSPRPAAPADLILAWYDRHHRDLPWRVSPPMAAGGIRPDPYRVWLSEVMLQQTTVQAVKAYFALFTTRWPTVTDLARADTEDVMKSWAGLGYYARARNLKKCAEAVAFEHGGVFPDTEEGLKALPGIGDYTAAAIAAIAFGRQSAVLDGNVERVVSRLHAIETPLPAAKPEMRALVAAMTPADRPGDFAQAMMDLGATICTPRRPACALCPLNAQCRLLGTADPELYPRKAAKKEKPVRLGAAFVAENAAGAVLLRKRGETGLLGGMSEPPGTAWSEAGPSAGEAAAGPFPGEWRPAATVGHVFTHFRLELEVRVARIAAGGAAPAGAWWSQRASLDGEALPTVFRKAIAAGLAAS